VPLDVKKWKDKKLTLSFLGVKESILGIKKSSNPTSIILITMRTTVLTFTFRLSMVG